MHLTQTTFFSCPSISPLGALRVILLPELVISGTEANEDWARASGLRLAYSETKLPRMTWGNELTNLPSVTLQ